MLQLTSRAVHDDGYQNSGNAQQAGDFLIAETF
jgi:hypothetical protein